MKPWYFTLVMYLMGLIFTAIIILIADLFELSKTSLTTGGLVGALLTGHTYARFKNEMPPLKTRLISCGFFFLLQVGSFVGYLMVLGVDLALIDWKVILVMHLIYTAAVFIMIYFGARNYIRTKERLNKYK